MTHNLKELRRQFDQAVSKVSQARDQEREALTRLQNALIADAEADFAARGIIRGQKVALPIGVLGVYARGVYDGFRVANWSKTTVEPIVRVTTKTGKIHKTQTHLIPEKFTIEAAE